MLNTSNSPRNPHLSFRWRAGTEEEPGGHRELFAMQKSNVYNVSAPSFVSGMGTKGRATAQLNICRS